MKCYVLVLAFIVSYFVSADAASLFGKVVDVARGGAITIYNLKRPVRVKVMGVAAPGMNQVFGDVAKKHLADLVFEKSVLVEYAGIAPDSSLTGRVLLNDADIGAQMIRDGVAWFDPTTANRETWLVATAEPDCPVGVYQNGEDAKEFRGEREGDRSGRKAETQWSSSGINKYVAHCSRN